MVQCLEAVPDLCKVSHLCLECSRLHTVQNVGVDRSAWKATAACGAVHTMDTRVSVKVIKELLCACPAAGVILIHAGHYSQLYTFHDMR